MFIFYLDKIFRGGGYNKNMKKHKHYQGFTIIEVVLVLAIAGLIFLMVFLALPALQRSQRDTQRKQTISRIAATLEQARVNNKGVAISDSLFDDDLYKFIQNYLRPHESEYVDPSTGRFYTFFKCGGKVNCGTGEGQDGINVGEIYYNSKATCGDDGRFIDQEHIATNFILLTRLEGGGLYCFSSSN